MLTVDEVQEKFLDADDVPLDELKFWFRHYKYVRILYEYREPRCAHCGRILRYASFWLCKPCRNMLGLYRDGNTLSYTHWPEWLKVEKRIEAKRRYYSHEARTRDEIEAGWTNPDSYTGECEHVPLDERRWRLRHTYREYIEGYLVGHGGVSEFARTQQKRRITERLAIADLIGEEND